MTLKISTTGEGMWNRITESNSACWETLGSTILLVRSDKERRTGGMSEHEAEWPKCVVFMSCPKQLIHTSEKGSDTGLVHYMNKPTTLAPSYDQN